MINDAGDVLTYTVVLENTGNQTLTNVVLGDDLVADAVGTPVETGGTGTNGDGNLDVGETWTYTYDYTVLQSDIDSNATNEPDNVIAGKLDNTATSTTTEIPEEKDDDEQVDLAQDPDYTITKTLLDINDDTNDTVINDAGDVLTYTVVLENTGNQTLTNVVLGDDLVADAVGTPVETGGTGTNGDGNLDVGETWTYTYDYTVLQSDIDSNATNEPDNVIAGKLDNTATSTTTEIPEEKDDDEQVDLAQDPDYTITKTLLDINDDTNDTVINDAGDVLTYTVVLENTGNQTLTNVVLGDDLVADAVGTPVETGGTGTNGDGNLDVGETWTYTYDYTVLQSDIDSNATNEPDNVIAGKLDNTATSTTTEIPEEKDDDEQVDLAQDPDYTITKTLLDINDDTNDTVINDAGDVLTYTVVLENTGNQTLTNVVLGDDLVADAVGTPVETGGTGTNGDGNLDVGETWTYTYDYTVLQSDIDSNATNEPDNVIAGKLDNTATSTTTEIPEEKDDDEQVDLAQDPDYTITKTLLDINDDTNDTVINDAGDVLTYTVVLENTGNQTLTNVVLGDDLVADAVGTPVETGGTGTNGDGNLDVGETWTYTYDYTVLQSDIDSNATNEPDNVIAGKLDNTATSTTTEIPEEKDDDEQVDVLLTPSVDIEKTTNGQDADIPTGPEIPVGDTVTWTYLVTNTGNVALTGVNVTDTEAGVNPVRQADQVGNNDNILDVGEIWVYEATGVAVAGQYMNTGSVSAFDPREDEVGDEDPSHYFGVEELVVISNDKGPGSKPLVTIIDASDPANPTEKYQFLAYEETYANGVRIAIGDLDGDGFDEIVTAPGAAHEALIKVFTRSNVADITSWVEADSFLVYDVTFDGGATVAIGDFLDNGDDDLDIVVTPSRNAVTTKIFENIGGLQFDTTPYKEFFAFGPNFIGGSVVSSANMDNSGPDEVIVGSGTGIRATVNVWDIENVPTITQTFLPFSDTFLGGVSLDMGDVNNDTIPDLIVGAGYRGMSAVEVWDGSTGVRLTSFTAYTDSSKNAPVRVAGQDTDGDGVIDRILTVQGAQGATNEIRAFDLVFGDNETLDEVLDVNDLNDPDLFGAYFIDLMD